MPLLTTDTLKFNLHIIGRAKKGCEFNQKRSELKNFLFLKLNPDTKSKRAKIKKPCGTTTQFSAGLYCQARNQLRTELVAGWRGEEGCLAPSVNCGPLLAVFGVGYKHNRRVPSGAYSETHLAAAKWTTCRRLENI